MPSYRDKLGRFATRKVAVKLAKAVAAIPAKQRSKKVTPAQRTQAKALLAELRKAGIKAPVSGGVGAKRKRGKAITTSDYPKGKAPWNLARKSRKAAIASESRKRKPRFDDDEVHAYIESGNRVTRFRSIAKFEAFMTKPDYAAARKAMFADDARWVVAAEDPDTGDIGIELDSGFIKPPKAEQPRDSKGRFKKVRNRRK